MLSLIQFITPKLSIARGLPLEPCNDNKAHNYIPNLSSLDEFLQFLCVIKVATVFCTYDIYYYKTNMNSVILYADSSKKCHTSVNFLPIFTFKDAIESL